ncbi:S-adenosyl-L-methionine-dependent methyltransferase [Talaromyces proteolyticus]|uniref:catechol O-methyltransferase n=1 Tax=Talaromyces proteolyticus TaxID=1131652 RepID=A0AAD4L0D9_9EURO|nr:S-adenosyl-L-methionine-dependent methyltransferase [Talaromyces proteolyticus]KAH8701550.1 S-adenosyl-L-methionine-dependent methyltransferase [Talaromyces proteolyticus]
MSFAQDVLDKYPSLQKLQGIPEEEIVESHDGREIRLLRYIYNHPKLHSELRGSPKKILQAMDEFAAKEEFLISIGPQKSKILQDLVASHRPKQLVELGTYVGYSAILFGDAMLRAQQDSSIEREDIRVYSIELDPLIASIAMNLVSLAGLSHIIEIVVGPSADTLKRLHDEGVLASGSLDMLFIDHVEDLYQPDCQLCESLGLLDKSGCLVVADNVVRPGAPLYRDYVRRNSRFRKSWAVPALIIPGDIPVSFPYPI